MKKYIIIGMILIMGFALYAKDSSIKLDKNYTMICKDKIIDINFVKDINKTIYDSSKIKSEKPIFDMGINYCKIDNYLYISAGKTFKYNINTKKLESFLEGDLLTCLIEQKLIFYKKENKLYIYSIKNGKSKYISWIRKSKENWLDNHRGISISNQKALYFNDNEKVLKYDFKNNKLENTKIINCNVANINMNGKILCQTRNSDTDNQKFYLENTDNYNKEFIQIGSIRDMFFDESVNGIFYTDYNFDIATMKENRSTFFYSIKEGKEYLFSKDCHF